MRERKWVLFVFALIFVVIAAYLYGLQIFKANERIKTFVLQQIRPMLGENCSISQVKLGFGNIRFIDVDIPLPDKQFSVSVENIRIGFNIYKMIFKGINPESISEDILINHPRIYLHLDEADTTNKVLTYPNFSEIKNTYKKQFQRLEILNRLSIIEGELYYQFNDSLSILLAHSIEGGFFTGREDSLELRLTGKLFTSNEVNLNMLARAHNKKGTISYIKAELLNYNLRDYIPEELLPEMRFTMGELNGNLFLSRKSKENQGFDLKGDIQIQNGSAELYDKKLEISDLNVQTHINDWNLVIDKASQRVNGTLLDISGRVFNVVFPYFDINVKSEDVQVADFKTLFDGTFGEKLSGKVNVKSKITGTIDNIKFLNTIYSDSIKFDKHLIEKVQIINSYNKKQLIVNQCDLEYADNFASLTGSMDFNSPAVKIDGVLDINGNVSNFFQKQGADNLSEFGTYVYARIDGSLKQPLIDGNSEFALVSTNNDSLKVSMDLQYADKKLQVVQTNLNGDPDVVCSVNFNSQPAFIDLKIKELQKYLVPYIQNPFTDYLMNSLSVGAQLKGSMSQFNLSSNIKHIDGGYFRSELANFQVDFAYKKQLNGWGKVVLYPDQEYEMVGDFRFHRNKNQTVLDQFNLADQLFAKLVLDRDNLLSGNISTKKLEIATLVHSMDVDISGIVDVNMDIAGHLSEPRLDTQVDIFDLKYDELGPYSANLKIMLDSSKVSIPGLTLNSLEATLLYAQGDYNFAADSLDFFIKGAGFNFSEILQNTDDEVPAFSGNALIDISVAGSSHNPKIKGLFAVKDGNIYDVPFDEIETNFGHGDNEYPGLFIEDFRLTRHNVYEVNGSGFYPFSSRDSLFVMLEGEGNFLQILSDKVSFFQQPKSQSKVSAQISGTPSNPVLESATVKLENGDMQCSGVIPHMTELKGDFEFIPDEQFIHVKEISGLMGGKPFKIYNTLAPVKSAKPLENIIIGDTGLNLGIIIPEAGKKGVPLNIDGLMEPGVYGNLEMVGRDGEDHFYFAWIDDKPTFRGQIKLYDCEIMYPFYEGTSDPDQTVKDFFYSMEWDMLVTPEQDVRYVKTFSGAIDNVYVNLQLNEKYSELGFTGQLMNDSFRIIGEARSTKGVIEYLGMDFRIDRAGAEFDKSTLEPVVYGSARTTVADSTGVPSQIYLTMQTHDITMDKKPVDDIARLEDKRGRWNQIRFKLTSDNPSVGSSERQILSSLGYSNASLQQNPAIDAIGFGTENLLLRPLIRPVERSLEKNLSLDYVRFSSMFTKNLLEFNLNNNLQVNNRLALLKSTRLVVGKYIVDNVFFQYTGQVESGIDYRYKDINVGLHHRMGLEYQINPRLLLELEYDYDSLIWQRENRDDKRIVLRHWFPF